MTGLWANIALLTNIATDKNKIFFIAVFFNYAAKLVLNSVKIWEF
jgi:hypothetical protein